MQMPLLIKPDIMMLSVGRYRLKFEIRIRISKTVFRGQCIFLDISPEILIQFTPRFP